MAPTLIARVCSKIVEAVLRRDGTLRVEPEVTADEP